MATKQPTKPEAVETPPQQDETSLQEWCANTSATDRRVEMLGAFFSMETQAGRGKATPEVFAERYAAFANRPL